MTLTKMFEKKVGAVNKHPGATGINQDWPWRPGMYGMIDTPPAMECGAHAWGFRGGRWRHPRLSVVSTIPPGRRHKLTTSSYRSDHIPSSNRWVAAVTRQHLTNTCFFVAPPSHGSPRDTAAEMQEGALGSETAEPAQQAGAGGP